MHDVLPESTRQKMIRVQDPFLHESFAPCQIHAPVILICGHGGRDQRCGVMGPLLRNEFRIALVRSGFQVLGVRGLAIPGSEGRRDQRNAIVGLISHIGGHRFAGNVIVYLPPQYSAGDIQAGRKNRWAGKGIWYGRVEPKHVEGIVKETILNGRIIEELFRGGVGADGKLIET